MSKRSEIVRSEIVEARARAMADAINIDFASMAYLPKTRLLHQAAATLDADKALGLKSMGREPTEAMLKSATDTPGMRAVEGACVMAHIHGCGIPNFVESPIKQAITASWDAASWAGEEG